MIGPVTLIRPHPKEKVKRIRPTLCVGPPGASLTWLSVATTSGIENLVGPKTRTLKAATFKPAQNPAAHSSKKVRPYIHRMAVVCETDKSAR